MATTTKETEALPAAYPATPDGLSLAAAMIEAGLIWQRIEAYTRQRFSTREVMWIIEGCGEWTAPLSPATVTATEIWEGDAWVAFTPTPGPEGGYAFKGFGPYRVTADVGAGPVPAAVNEAFRRLAEYFAQTSALSKEEGSAGVVRYAFSIGQISENWARSPAWAAKAMESSGAGDLLRPYRRAA